MHKGMCKMHEGGKPFICLQSNMARQFLAHNKETCQVCRACQVHDIIQRNMITVLTWINNPIPFTMWGLNIIGMFPT